MVCAASLQQSLAGDSVDVFLFAFLSGTRCGGCWDHGDGQGKSEGGGACYDRGLGPCLRHRHRSGRPSDGLSEETRAEAASEWRQRLRLALAMCPGSIFGAVDVAEDWEFDQAEVGDRYYLPRRMGLTQNHYPIQLWGVQRCFRMVEESEVHRGVRYTAVLRARLDSYWFAPIPSLRPLLASGSVLVRGAADAEYRVPSDQFAVVPREHAEVYFVQWLEDLANQTFVQRIMARATERWNRYVGAEGALMLAFEEHGVPYQREPFAFSVFRPNGRCFNLGQPPGIQLGCSRALAGLVQSQEAGVPALAGGPPSAAYADAMRRCTRHTCCNSHGDCSDGGDAPFSCRCQPLPESEDWDFGAWLLQGPLRQGKPNNGKS
ncbi:unnamed protein product [Polarella glacialis]|uniref:Uncharacterized protein n=2 Tax=Polarella glacialis TaxID=89957 RepID=A0A813EBE5_POLGL|nr:unnamed protein product [Polarella glacialis]